MQQAERGGFYYKVLERFHPSAPKLTARIGLRACEFQHFQEDHLMLLIQRVNCSLHWSRLVLLDRSALFLETLLDFKPEEEILS